MRALFAAAQTCLHNGEGLVGVVSGSGVRQFRKGEWEGRIDGWLTPKELPPGEAKLPAALLLCLEEEGLAHFCQSQGNALGKHREETGRKTFP